MKNNPIAQPQPSPAWREALALLDADLRRRGSAQRTCDAYATDLLQLARWGTAQGIEPAAMDLRALRRNAAHLSDVGNGPATVARKLAAARALFRVLREHVVIEQNPGDLVPGPKRPSKLPRVLDPDEVSALLDRIPASTPLELRDSARFELAAPSGRGPGAARAAGPRAVRARLRQRAARRGARAPARRVGRLRRRGGPGRGQGLE